MMATFKLLLLASLSCFTQVTCQSSQDWLFTMTNSPKENKLVAYVRSNGTLALFGSFPTGGKGGVANEEKGSAIDPLGSQASIIVHQDKCIFLVNAGSDQISSYLLSNATNTPLVKVGLYGSGGKFPVSLTARDTSLYVLNAGGRGAISGYNIDKSNCGLTVKSNSIRSLNQLHANPPWAALSPGQISFTPDGKFLVVTLKGTKILISFAVSEGLIGRIPVRKLSSGRTPFSLAFDSNGHLLVVEAGGPDPNKGSVSSYMMNTNGRMTTISASVPNGETASCWITFKNGFAVVSNNGGDGSISVYNVNSSGALTLGNATAAAVEGAEDLAINKDGSRVYILSGGVAKPDGTLQPSIQTFSFSGGSLSFVASATDGLPLGTATPTITGVAGLALANMVV